MILNSGESLGDFGGFMRQRSVKSMTVIKIAISRTYEVIMIAAISLLASYSISSFILMFAAEKVSSRWLVCISSPQSKEEVDPFQNLRDMHLPWLILHPLITVGLLALLAYFAWLIGYDYTIDVMRRFLSGLLIFSMFISFCEFAVRSDTI